MKLISNKSNSEIFTAAYDTVDSMDLADIKKIAIEKIIEDINKRKAKEIAKGKATKKEPQYHFTKAYKIPLRRLVMSHQLTTAEKAFMFDMIPFVNRETNILVDDRGFPMEQQKIMKMLSIGRTKIFTITKGLIEKGLLFPEHENGKVYYRMNPEYFECKRKELI